MPTLIKLRRLSTTARLAVTPANGEPVLDLTTKALFIGDGATAGGVPVVGSYAISDTFVVASQAAMLALTGAEKGDLCVRTDLSKTFVLAGTSYATLADWQELLVPTAGVSSVAGKAGAVTLVVADVGGAAPVASPAFTGTPTVPTAATATNTTQAASTAFVQQELAALVIDGGTV
jgi:hypothetical protein